MENLTRSFKETNLVLQLIQESQIKCKTVMSWSSRKKKECIFLTLILSEGIFLNIYFMSIYSVLNTLSEHTYFYISKNIISYTFLLVFNIVQILHSILKKIKSDDKTKCKTFYSYSKAETVINEGDIDEVFQSIYTPVISDIQIFLEKISGCIIDSVIYHHINISKYNPLFSQIITSCRP